MVLLPEGSDPSLAELREMAARQQQQIEAQQQLLVAKEQRLKFLKQQESRHQQNFTQPQEGLRLLRDKVEGQERKLRRLRALRGQADQQKATNGNLTAELETTRALFNEKEKELSLAVAKVEELTRQLEELRSGNLNGIIVESNSVNTLNAPSVAELEKLRRELLYRTKLNEQQNARIQQQRDTLCKRQDEVSKMDQRIAELQQRIQRKHNLNQQLANSINAAAQAKQRANQIKATRPRPLSTNIAAVEPVKRVPQESDRCHDDLKLKGNEADADLSAFGLKKNDPKYQTLPYNTKFSVKSNKDSSGSGEETDKPLLIIPDKDPESDNKKMENINSLIMCPNGRTTKTQLPNQIVSPISPPSSKIQPPHSVGNLASRPFGSSYNSSVLSNIRGHSDTTTSSSVMVSSVHTSTNTGSTNHIPSSKTTATNKFPRTSLSPSPTSSSLSSSSSSSSSSLLLARSKLPTAVTTSPATTTSRRNNLTISPSNSESSPVHDQQKIEVERTSSSSSPESKSSSVGSLENVTGENEKNRPSLPPKPLVPVKPIPPPRQTHVVGLANSPSGRGSEVDSALSILKGSGNKAFGNTMNGNGYRYVMKSLQPQTFGSRLPVGAATMDQYTKAINHVYRTELQNQQHSTVSDSIKVPVSSDFDQPSKELPSDLDNFRKTISSIGHLPIRPKPLTIKKPSGLDPPRLRASITNGSALTVKRLSDNNGISMSYSSPTTARVLSNRKNESSSFLHIEESTDSSSPSSERLDGDLDETDKSVMQPRNINDDLILRGISPKTNDSLRPQTNNSTSISSSPDTEKESSINEDTLDEENNILREMRKKFGIYDPGDYSAEDDLEDGSEEGVFIDQQLLSSGDLLRRSSRKGNLKTKGSSRHPRRVSFDPLALLLDASLEGELELVKKTAKEVPNPSAANDEGITALHNAICAGHLEIVQFLVEFGCDVNAKDSDGWTPLHCAASCNNLVMVKFLVEHGACIFATTLSDHETAAEKCEEDEEGFDGCTEYLYSIQEKLGILNGGAVYAVYEYEAQNPDELSFKESDLIVVLRKGDDLEREWWWSKLRDREGYVPRNLLGLHPRVPVKTETQ